jgi:3alpha(or 20beta)-hydroxysteroid dehydrogenase
MGEAHVRRFVAEGARVLLTDILDEEGHNLARSLGAAAQYLHHDVTSETEWNAAVRAAVAAFRSIDILVNNAGIVLRGPIESFREADYRRVIDINQIGVFLGMKSVLRSMRAAGGGSIINISSVAGLVGRPESIAYASSKYAVRGMTKVAAAEFGQFNIRVNSVHPGPILTPMFAGMPDAGQQSMLSELSIGRPGEPDEVSSLLVFLAADESAYCTASEFVIDGGMSAR